MVVVPLPPLDTLPLLHSKIFHYKEGEGSYGFELEL